MEEPKVIVFGVDGLIPELVYKFAAEGHLPNINNMLKEGTSAELLPYISTWGDVNWVSFLSGQAPGDSWKGQNIPKENEGNLLDIMEKESKKAALVHFPQTLSTAGTSHFCFAPYYANPSFEAASSAVYTTDLGKWPEKRVEEFLGWPPVGTLAHHIKSNRFLIEKMEEDWKFFISLHGGGEIVLIVKPFTQDKVVMKLPEGRSIEIKYQEWSDWVTLPLENDKNGMTRFKLVHYDQENQEMDLLQSQITIEGELSNDSEIETYLLNKYGPFISNWTVTASPEEKYHETSFEEGKYQAMWLAEAALGLLDEKDYHLFATVFRLNDETHHTSLAKYDPASPFYTPEEAPRYEENIRESYKVLDQAVGRILKGKKKDTTLIVASDHGDVPNHYFCDVHKRLEECSLCVLDEEGKQVQSESKAYLKDERGGMEVFVNLKGRDEQGIVPPEDYEKVQNEVFRALTTWSHTDLNEILPVTALTIKKQDAAIIGYWGPDVGDVVFAYDKGFVWGKNSKDVTAPVSGPGANHGPQIPTASTNHSSNLGIAMFYGKIANRKAPFQQTEAPFSMVWAGKMIAELLNVRKTDILDT
ncbi:alkaline phosphatase family protein [Salibacterium halotolerans]|uniref:Type I phosphodiesterase / nucleotide pyrophosphatase n=1 Tax=Salibacterium halotolerans TaxID=1884432 RepID=A0A1I5U6P3_9BACI|nr:alkaline phosphatase family protein [Salibacterium halotolerans]SFP90900.1 Type I phosphodiesterase / nucleotide pyrophosphatase [Salibacterium halotolerans]